MPLALAVGPQGAVLALEPNPYVFPVLQKNAELNADKTAIVALMFAAMPEAGETHFEYSDSGFCNGGLHAGISKWRHGHAFKLKVRGENLEAYLGGHHASLVPRIRLVKVDAEGYDFQVLSSLKNLLAAQKPYVKAEVFKLLDSSQRERLFDLLAGLGYRVHVIESDTKLLGPELKREDVMLRRHYDVFCVPAR